MTGFWREVSRGAVMTPDECKRTGGHCWVDARNSYIRGDGVHFRGERCKHCPATRSGVSREPWEWTVNEEPRADLRE